MFACDVASSKIFPRLYVIQPCFTPSSISRQRIRRFRNGCSLNSFLPEKLIFSSMYGYPTARAIACACLCSETRDMLMPRICTKVGAYPSCSALIAAARQSFPPLKATNILGFSPLAPFRGIDSVSGLSLPANGARRAALCAIFRHALNRCGMSKRAGNVLTL